MRVIRRFIVLGILGVSGVAAYNYWSDSDWPLRPSAVSVDAQTTKRQAQRVANQAVVKAADAAHKLGDTMTESTLTAKIKSKMALDDYVKARAIDVDTSGSAVTLRGTVASKAERDRAVRLARETAGVTQVIDRLRVR
jgi:hyperosmotically inducible periplasmic protein